MEENKSTEIVAYSSNVDFAKSNFIISAKYKSTLLENKILAVALAKINTGREEHDTGLWVVELKSADLKRILGTNSGSFYEKLDPISREMTGKSIGMSDPVKRKFEYYAMVVTSKYENNVLTIKFNPDLKKYLKNIKQNFTILKLSTMMSFRSVYSFRMYELLKSKCYSVTGIKQSEYTIPFSISELKLEMGIVNANSDNVRKILHGSDTPDYDKAVKAAKEVTYSLWSEFRRRVLDVGVKEINEKTEMQVSYDILKEGVGAKITSVIFHVKVEEVKERCELTEKDIADFFDELPNVLGFMVKYSELKAIADEAEYDMDRVRQAVKVMNTQRSDVGNKVGFIIKAIRENYILERGRKARRKKVNDFTDIDQHMYDFDELEDDLLEMNDLINR